MIPSPTNPTRSRPAMPTTSRCLDSKSVAGAERAGRLARQLLAVDQVPTPGAGLATVRSRRGVAAALGDQRVAHLGQRLQLADHAVAAGLAARAAPAPPEGGLDRPRGGLPAERPARGG